MVLISRGSVRRLSIAGIAFASVLASAIPAFAGSGTGTTPTFTASYTVDAVAFDGPGCVPVPFAVDYTIAGAATGFVRLDLAFSRSNAPVSGAITVTAAIDPPSGRKTGEISFCPASYIPGRGPLNVTGVVISPRGGVVEQVTPSTVTVIQNPVRMSRPKVSQSLGSWVLKGSAEALTPSRGWVGATGAITIQTQKSGSRRWVSGETVALDQFGSWRTVAPILTATYPRGTAFRAVLTGCNWCKNSSVTGTLR